MVIEKKYRLLMLAILFVMLCLQSLTIINFGNFNLKLVHLYSICFLPLLVKLNRIILPNKIITAFVIFIVGHAFIMAKNFGINSLLLNYLFGYYLLIIVMNIGSDLTKDDWLKLFRRCSFVFLGLVWMNNLQQIDIIIDFLNAPLHHPVIKTLIGGGVNIEASWLNLFCFFFGLSKTGTIYFTLCVLTTIIYMSRAAMVILVLYMCFSIFFLFDRNKIFSLLSRGFILFASVYAYGKSNYMVSRFANIGNEPGSIGRLKMYEVVPDALITYPFGCGIGNCMNVLREVSGINFYEGNLHNVFLQMFIDLGWIGGLVYLVIILVFVKKRFFELKLNSILALLFAYLIISLIQFRGGDSIIFYILGAYFCIQRFSYKDIIGYY